MELEKPEGELTPEDYQGLKKLSVYRVGNPVFEQAIGDLKKALPGCKIDHD